MVYEFIESLHGGPQIDLTGEYTGWQVRTSVRKSGIQGGGKGRFAEENIKAGTIMRIKVPKSLQDDVIFSVLNFSEYMRIVITKNKINIEEVDFEKFCSLWKGFKRSCNGDFTYHLRCPSKNSVCSRCSQKDQCTLLVYHKNLSRCNNLFVVSSTIF